MQLLLGFIAVLLFGAVPVAALVVALIALGRSRNAASRSLEERTAVLERRLQALQRRLGTAEGEPAPVPPPWLHREEVVAAPEHAAELPKPSSPPPQAPPRVEPPPPLEPDTNLEQRIGARWTAWVGAIVIVFTVAFFLKWSFENNLIGPAGRVTLGFVSGVGLLIAGLALRRRDLPFLSEGLAGGGLAILYLSTYAAYGLYHFLGPAAAFGCMFGVTVTGSVVSIATRKQSTAVLAVLGGLLTPVLLATDHSDERVLLGYLWVLDLLALGVARGLVWPALNRLAWVGTVLLFLPVLVHHPAAPDPAMRLVLLTALFLLFLVVPLIRPWAERKRADPLDIGLTVGNAAAYFSAVYVTLEMWRPAAEGPHALALAALYLWIARRYRTRVPDDAVGIGVHLGNAAVLLSLAFPLAFDGPWVTLAWAVQATVFLSLAPRSPTPVVLGGGIILFALSVARAVALDPEWYPPTVPVWNLVYLVHLLVVVALGVAGVPAKRVVTRPGREVAAGGELRSILWFTAAALLAILLRREPTGLWSWGLLAVEMLGLAWLGRKNADVCFAPATVAIAGVLLARALVTDHRLAASAAVDLINAPLLMRIAACGAIAVAGAWLARSELGRILSGSAGVVLLIVLTLGWTLHEDVALRDARAVGDDSLASHITWKLQVGVSLLWTLYAAAALAWGFVSEKAIVRYAALSLLGIVLIKVFLVDLSELQAIYRILSFLVLGLVLLAVSLVYQRSRRSTA